MKTYIALFLGLSAGMLGCTHPDIVWPTDTTDTGSASSSSSGGHPARVGLNQADLQAMPGTGGGGTTTGAGSATTTSSSSSGMGGMGTGGGTTTSSSSSGMGGGTTTTSSSSSGMVDGGTDAATTDAPPTDGGMGATCDTGNIGTTVGCNPGDMCVDVGMGAAACKLVCPQPPPGMQVPKCPVDGGNPPDCVTNDLGKTWVCPL